MKTRLLEIKDRVKTAKAALYQLALEGNLNLNIGAGNHAIYELDESYARVGEILEELGKEEELKMTGQILKWKKKIIKLLKRIVGYSVCSL